MSLAPAETEGSHDRVAAGCLRRRSFSELFYCFLVEPIAAKQLVPVLGGSAAVWITCLVFFQTAFLCAYLYAHWITRRALWTGTSFCFFSLRFLQPDGAVRSRRGTRVQSSHHHCFCCAGQPIGLPFLMLGTTSPLMQVWWARLECRDSLSAVCAVEPCFPSGTGPYPTLIEPRFTLQLQRIAWCCGFALFAVISVILAWSDESAVGTVAVQFQPKQGQTPLDSVASQTALGSAADGWRPCN